MKQEPFCLRQEGCQTRDDDQPMSRSDAFATYCTYVEANRDIEIKNENN